MHISIKAETLFRFMGFPITNSVVGTLLTSVTLIILAFVVYKNLNSERPGMFQTFIEATISFLYELTDSVSEKHAKEFFPLITTMFLFVIVSNWYGLVPGISAFSINHEEPMNKVHTTEVLHEEDAGAEDINAAEVEKSYTESGVDDHAINAEEHVSSTPIFRAATADLNTTLALALISVIAIQYYAIKHLGIGLHLKKFFDFSSPIAFYVGILELVSEVSKIVSFAFRLFGNIFAGEVLLAVIGMIPLIIPLPFLGLEIFVGFIQATVFAVLTLVFLSMAVEKHH